MQQEKENKTNLPPQKSEIVLQLRGLDKRFEAVVALNQANLTLKRGEIMALLGSNGSGKSTMVKVLSGLVKPDAGQIVINGNQSKIRNCGEARQAGVAVAYQDLSLIPEMSAIDNIVLGIEPVKKNGLVDRQECRRLAIWHMEKLGIESEAERLVKELRPSTQSLVEIAKAMALQPEILILDESTASLHSEEVKRVFELLFELKAKGTSIIMVTHRMSEIFKVCDRCTILKAGETVIAGDISALDINQIVFHMTGQLPDRQIHSHKADELRMIDQALQIPLLKVEAVSAKKLRKVDFSAQKGEIVGIGGLDGQGQKEFLHVLLGDEAFDTGRIHYNQKLVHYKSVVAAIADGMGFISGDRNQESIFPIRTVAENIYAAQLTKRRLFSRLHSSRMNQFAEQVMGKYGIVAGGLELPANSLSGGNQQKLVVGRWIALAPRLLLLDDPTKGVDIHSRQEIHRLLMEAAEEGMTIIYVSSDNEELLEVADRIYVFYEGQISACLAQANRTEEKLVAAMLGLHGQASTAKMDGRNEYAD